ncbi:PAS domain S-box protein [Stutzerimonas urumqiensis]|uniref:PAS domain S-box protein n=1 Tax=Stutzerimonas urumqiensis TaxID=638269 RepID=UPI003DA62537
MLRYSVVALLWVAGSAAGVHALDYPPWAGVVAALILVFLSVAMMRLLTSRFDRGLAKAQRSLSDSEKGFLTLLEASPASIWLYDLHSLTLMKANPAAEFDYGYTLDDLQTMSLSDLFDDRMLDTHVNLSRNAGLEQWLQGEHSLRTKSGARRVSRITASVCCMGRRTFGVLVANDRHVHTSSATERVKSCAQLAQQVAGLGYWLYELDTGIGECSEEVRRLFGLEEGQSFNRRCFDAVVQESEREAVNQVHATAAKTGQAMHQYQIQGSGDAYCLYERIRLKVDHKSGHRMLFGAVLDVSELRSNDTRLARQRTLYQRIINGFAEGVVVIRGDSIQFANEAARKMLLVERPDNKLFAQYIHPEERAREVDRMRALQRGLINESPLRQVRLVRADTSELEAEVIEIRLGDTDPSDIQLLIRDVTQTRRMQMDLEDANRRLQALSQRLMEVQETERRQLARDLHDDIGQQLTGLKLHLQRMARQMERDDTLRDLAATLIDTIDTLLATVRRLSLALHPLQLESLGLESAMRSHLSRFLPGTGLRYTFRVEGSLDELPTYPSLVAFRIFQEAVNNLVRHARAKSVQVNLTRLADGLRLEVVDDGLGFDVAAAHQSAQSLGLTSMHERVASLRGDLKISSLIGVGTRIAIWLPAVGWELTPEEDK